jgi:hypothetical protein
MQVLKLLLESWKDGNEVTVQRVQYESDNQGKQLLSICRILWTRVG